LPLWSFTSLVLTLSKSASLFRNNGVACVKYEKQRRTWNGRPNNMSYYVVLLELLISGEWLVFRGVGWVRFGDRRRIGGYVGGFDERQSILYLRMFGGERDNRTGPSAADKKESRETCDLGLGST